MTIYSNIDSYLIDKHEALRKLFFRANIDTSRINTLVVPPEKDIKEITSALKGTDHDKYQHAVDILYAHIFKSDFSSPRLSGGGEVVNRLNQKCKLSAIAKGKFSLESGAGLGTKAECEFDPDFIAAKGHKIDVLPICVAIRKSGEIATDGEIVKKASFDAEEVYEVVFQAEVTGGSEETKKLKMANYKTLIARGRKAFTETMCGLMAFLDKTDVPEYVACRSMVASLASYDTFGMYIAIIQPENSVSFLPESIYMNVDGAWSFTIAYSGDYCDLIDTFASKHLPVIDSDARKEAISKMRSLPTNTQISQHFKKLYDEYVPKIFGSSYPLSPMQKLWADEILFKSACMCPGIEEMMSSNYPGANYESESVFLSWDYNKSFGDPNAPNGPIKFYQSEYMFKYTIVSDAKCRDETAKHANPITAMVKAFCMING